MNSDILAKLDIEHVLRFKLSENPKFPITQTYIYELIKIIDYNKEIVKTITSDEHSELLAYITSLYSRLISPNINKTSKILDKSDCMCSDDKLYNFCIHSVNAFIKCKHFNTIIKIMPLFNLFLINTTDFYKDNLVFTACFTDTPKLEEHERALTNADIAHIITIMLAIFENYTKTQRLLLAFILFEFIIKLSYYKINKQFADTLLDRIKYIKSIIISDNDVRLQFHDIITRCNCTTKILDDWHAIITNHYSNL
jgi:hypothetical protein